MPKRQSPTGSELFIVDNSDDDWKAARYLRDWCQLSSSIDIAIGYLEIGAVLALGDEGCLAVIGLKQRSKCSVDDAPHR